MARKKATFNVCGPVKDGHFNVWVVRGPNGGHLGSFVSREAARQFIKTHRQMRDKKELMHVAK